MSDDAAGVDRLLSEFREATGPRFVAAYRFGSDVGRGKGKGQPRVLLLVDEIDRTLLDTVGPHVCAAQLDGVRVRVDTADNLVRGADAFPAFTLELIRHRTLLSGSDILEALAVDTADLRLHVEHGLRGMFRDLVASYIAGKVHGSALLKIRRSTRRLVFLLEGALIAAKSEISDTPPATEVLLSARANIGGPDDAWQTLSAFLDDSLRLDTAGMRRLYGALLAILPLAIDWADRIDRA